MGSLLAPAQFLLDMALKLEPAQIVRLVLHLMATRLLAPLDLLTEPMGFTIQLEALEHQIKFIPLRRQALYGSRRL